jgi:tRNA (cytidine/uridine-2'-O-)-methyltransferase
MVANHPQICLFQPEIPQNTGAIARLAAGAGCRLHLVKPLGFSLGEKELRRAGLDYWPYLDLEIHDDLDQLLQVFGPSVAFLSKFGTTPYTSIPTSTSLLVFGRETTGLPAHIKSKYQDQLYRIPIFHPAVRSLNLANAVSVIVYDQLSRRGAW